MQPRVLRMAGTHSLAGTCLCTVLHARLMEPLLHHSIQHTTINFPRFDTMVRAPSGVRCCRMEDGLLDSRDSVRAMGVLAGISTARAQGLTCLECIV